MYLYPAEKQLTKNNSTKEQREKQQLKLQQQKLARDKALLEARVRAPEAPRRHPLSLVTACLATGMGANSTVVMGASRGRNMTETSYVVISGGGSQILPPANDGGTLTAYSYYNIVPNPHNILGPVAFLVSATGDTIGNSPTTPTWGKHTTGPYADDNYLKRDFPTLNNLNQPVTGTVAPRVDPTKFGIFEVIDTVEGLAYNTFEGLQSKMLAGHLMVSIAIPTGGSVAVHAIGSRMMSGILNPDGICQFSLDGATFSVAPEPNTPVGNTIMEGLGLEYDPTPTSNPATLSSLTPWVMNVEGPNTVYIALPFTRTKEQYWQTSSSRILPHGFFGFVDGAWPIGNCMSALLSGQGSIQVIDNNNNAARSIVAVTYSAHYAIAADSPNPLIMDAAVPSDDFDDEGVSCMAGGYGISMQSQEDALAKCAMSCVKHLPKRIGQAHSDHALKLLGGNSAPHDSIAVGSGVTRPGRIDSYALMHPHPTKPGQVETVHGHNIVSGAKPKTSTFEDVLGFVKGAAEAIAVAGEIAALF